MKMELHHLCLILLISFVCSANGRRPNRVIGGDLIILTRKFKHQVSLWQDGKLSCVGTILNRNHVLVAAHCVDGIHQKRLMIKTGLSNVEKKRNHHVQVGRVDINPKYHEAFPNCDYLRNDIAVLKLERRLNFLNNVATVRLPKYGVAIGQVGSIGGWGITSYPHGSPSNDFLATTMNVLSPAECFEEGMGLREDQFCAIHAEKKATLAKGDSGSGFITNGTVYGITSITTCELDAPVIFTDVFYHLDFIKSILEKDKSLPEELITKEKIDHLVF